MEVSQATFFEMDYNALTAWATLVAVLVALFQQPLRNWWSTPKLRIGLPDSHKAANGPSIPTPARIYIYNNGRGVAEKIRVTVVALFEQGPGQRFKLRDTPISVNLKWQGLDQEVLDLLPTKTFGLAEPGKLVRFGSAVGSLSFMAIGDPKATQMQLPAGNYALRIVVSGANFKAKTELILLSVGILEGGKMEFSLAWPDETAGRELRSLEDAAQLNIFLR